MVLKFWHNMVRVYLFIVVLWPSTSKSNLNNLIWLHLCLTRHICWGCNLLRPCSKALGLLAIQKECTNWEKKHKKFFVCCCSLIFVNECLAIFNKSCQARGYQNVCFFFKVWQVSLDWSASVLMGPLHTWTFK